VTFEEVLTQTVAMLQRLGRVSYRALKRQFAIPDDYLEDLKDAILFAHPQVRDEDGRGLVWMGDTPTAPLGTESADRAPAPLAYTPPYLVEQILTIRSALEGERKQVTVLFCDITNSTSLAERLGAEAMHGLLSQFFELALMEIHRYEGTINQFRSYWIPGSWHVRMSYTDDISVPNP
jgi:hypothetical protein